MTFKEGQPQEKSQKSQETRFQKILSEAGDQLIVHPQIITSGLARMLTAWRAELLEIAGKDFHKYREMLMAAISSPDASVSSQNKFAAGFFFGRDFPPARAGQTEPLLAELFDSYPAARNGYAYALSKPRVGNQKDMSDFFQTGEQKIASNLPRAGEQENLLNFLQTMGIGVIVPGGARTPQGFTPQSRFDIPFQLPGVVAPPSSLTENGVAFYSAIISAFATIGAKVEKNGTVSNLPSHLTGADTIKFTGALSSGMDKWLSSIYTPTGKPVSSWISDNLKNASDYANFVTALKSGNFFTALSYLKEDSPVKNAFGKQSETTNYTIQLNRSELAALVRNSFSAGGAVNIQLDENDRSILQIYLQRDGIILVSNQLLATNTFDASLIGELNLLKGWWIEFRGGLGGRTQSLTGEEVAPPSPAQWFVHAGAETEFPLAGFLSATVGAAVAEIVQKNSHPYPDVEASSRLKAKLSNRFDVALNLSKVFAPGTTPDPRNASASVEVGWNLSPAIRASASAGTDALRKNIVGSQPVGFNLNVSFNIP